MRRFATPRTFVWSVGRLRPAATTPPGSDICTIPAGGRQCSRARTPDLEGSPCLNVRVAWFYGGGCTPAGSQTVVTLRGGGAPATSSGGSPQKSSPRRAPRAILPAAGAKRWLHPSAIPPKGPFRPGAEPAVDRGRPHRTPARAAKGAKSRAGPPSKRTPWDRVLVIAAPPSRSIPRA